MKRISFAAAALACCTPASAHDAHVEPRAYDHAPIGVMGDHLHKKGEFMLSARYTRMKMEGNRIGTNSISADEIATTIPNKFAAMAGQPPTLRIVPNSMDMNMVMLGAMYAPSDDVTLMVMGMYNDNDMDHTTYQGGMGTNVLGNFTTKTSGFGDTKVSALIRMFDNGTHKFHANAGISIPTGSNTETAEILSPMGMTPTVRVPYPMQLGSGTWELEPGLTYVGHKDSWNWGAQARATIRVSENKEGYTLGDRFEATSWVAYGISNSVSVSSRVKLSTQGEINESDPNIMGPVQTANIAYQGGKKIEVFAGLNYLFAEGALKGNRIGLEVGAPIIQDLNGPQLETDLTITIGWQIAF
jgi:hypothetical protein